MAYIELIRIYLSTSVHTLMGKNESDQDQPAFAKKNRRPPQLRDSMCVERTYALSPDPTPLPARRRGPTKKRYCVRPCPRKKIKTETHGVLCTKSSLYTSFATDGSILPVNRLHSILYDGRLNDGEIRAIRTACRNLDRKNTIMKFNRGGCCQKETETTHRRADTQNERIDETAKIGQMETSIENITLENTTYKYYTTVCATPPADSHFIPRK